MKLGKKAQYALLLVLFLARSGRARTVDAAVGLGLSMHFLEQVARKLRQAGIIRSVRGPGGGYELATDPTIGQVFEAIQVPPIFSKDEAKRCANSSNEDIRSMGELVGAMSSAVARHLNTSVTEFAKNHGAGQPSPTQPEASQ